MKYVKYGYSISDFANSLGVGRTTVYGLLRSGRLPSVKIGSRRIITIQPKDFLSSITKKEHKND